MTKKKRQAQNTLSTSYLLSRTRKQVFFLFHRQPNQPWYIRWLKGFNHVCLVVGVKEGNSTGFVWIEPAFQGAIIQASSGIDIRSASNDGWTVVRATATMSNKQRLIRPTFQTCTTIVQYLAGISLGAITAQGLYNKLTKSNPKWLKRHGLSEVTVWEGTQGAH